MLRWRRPIAAALAGLAVLCFATALRPASEPTVPVAVALGAVPAGASLTADDVDVRAYPAAWAPPGSYATVAEVVGRTASAPLAAGEPVTATRLVSAAERGAFAVPVRLQDTDVAALLEPGQRLDIVRARSDGTAAVIAQDVLVITVPRRSAGGAFGGERVPGSLVLVEADRATAVRLAAASTGDLSAILR